MSGRPGVQGGVRRDSFLTLLSPNARVALMSMSAPALYKAGDVLMSEGAVTGHVLILRSGWALAAAGREGVESVLRVYGPGDLVGESAVAPLNRPGVIRETSRTLTDVSALLVPVTRFIDLLRRSATAWLALWQVLQFRLDEADRRTKLNASGDARERLAATLALLAARHGPADGVAEIPFPLTQSHLAGLTDSSLPSVARALRSLREAGVVGTGRGRVTLADVEALRQVARLTPEELVPAGYVDIPFSGYEPGTAEGDSAERGTKWVAGGDLREVPSVAGRSVVIAVDVFEYSSRADAVQLHIRDALYRMLRRSFDEVGLGWDGAIVQDQGDGAVVVLDSARVDPLTITALVDRLLGHLRQHNQTSSERARIRLRMAIDVGVVHTDANGMTGRAIVNAFRMLDADEFRSAFSARPASLGLIVSNDLYEESFSTQYEGLPGSAFTPMSIGVKEGNLDGWVAFPSDWGVKSGLLGLTSREVEVAMLMTKGYSDREMAEALYLSVSTVRNHLSRIFTKLGVSSRVAAVMKIMAAR
ncbi:LuxR C-terminal-related transcriptional regulator [Sphaerisporangium sp. TRM90804]|uniref:LuxR C-terminal-related transcriptional regulator n=1 Tax=Sphaerisporangium sp. TRM90804 TaxID=3031113 RepID=UPI00244B284D|nr:LuxR C-terminal-related transcriptional regulator [Sphaerisporangium sp. TRM90804]MDH2424934.1 LuxR C-terminal-related transcriptional regulator [Sphaerisporangium sp. TRM90804]